MVRRPAAWRLPGGARRRRGAPPLTGRARGGRVRQPARLGGRRRGAQGRRQRRRCRLRDRARAGRPAPGLVGDRRRRVRAGLHRQGEEGLRARLPRARAGGDHAGRLLQGRARRGPSCRSAAGWRSRCRARCGAWARWCGAGASCRSAAASSRRRSWRRRASRCRGAWRDSLARARSQARRGDRQFIELFAAKPLHAGDDLAAARAGLDAGQAARGRRRRLLQGRDREGDRQGGARRGRRADRRGPRRLRRRRSHAARDRLPRAARALDAAVVVGRRRADRDAGHPGRALSDGRRPAARAGAGSVGLPARAGRGVQARASPIARASWATPTSSPVDVRAPDQRPPTTPSWRGGSSRARVLPRDALRHARRAARAAQGRRDDAPVGDRRRRATRWR